MDETQKAMQRTDSLNAEGGAQVAVVGAGSWGTALAQLLAGNGNRVRMWARKPEVAEGINEQHRNVRYLSHVPLSPNVTATNDLGACLEDADAVVFVTPSRLLRTFATQAAPFLGPDVPVMVCSKGVEAGTGALSSDVLADELGGLSRVAVLSGPNHAEEVIERKPAATVIASVDLGTAQRFQRLFSTPWFRCYVSDDVVGVELCAALKNVVAIAVGVAAGCGYGDNTAAVLMTRGMAEMGRLVAECGGSPLTVMGLAGAGDLIATCTSEHSRNRSFGKLLAQGWSVQEYETKTHMVVEGAVACKTVLALAERVGVELPIAEGVRNLVWGGATVEEVARTLVGRELKPEFWGLEGR